MPRLRALFPSHKNERRKTRGRTKTLVPPAKGIARLARARSSTPPPPQFFALDFWNLELSVRELGYCVTHDNTSRDFKTFICCGTGLNATTRLCQALKGGRGDGLKLVHHVEPPSKFFTSRKKKFSNDLKKTQTKATILKNELRKRDEELVATVEELKKEGKIASILIDSSRSYIPTRPLVAYPDPRSEPYLSILLPGFDEEEYFNHPAKVDDNTQASATEVEAKKEIKKEANRSNLL
ncbi:hypothetical protein Acr_04g0002750 [Actinidia rufa]|uniref:Uncharacterized protein n=1 Tax=Actinidia rufa TaxID=165716 RepID=A0A7J0EIT2_9ERIC|nr:hypothetical protein Acr_04g0002750 [Actinidia rufa]